MKPLLLAAVVAYLFIAAGLTHAETLVELTSAPPDTTLPPPGSVWHTLLPDADFCSEHIQELYEDNGDGKISAGDYITLTGERFLIVERCFLYHLRSLDEPPARETDVVIERKKKLIPDMFCWVSHMVYPAGAYCFWLHHGGHVDTNTNGIVDEGDHLATDGDYEGNWSIENITLGIKIVPETGVDDQEPMSTWSRIKRLFGLS